MSLSNQRGRRLTRSSTDELNLHLSEQEVNSYYLKFQILRNRAQHIIQIHRGTTRSTKHRIKRSCIWLLGTGVAGTGALLFYVMIIKGGGTNSLILSSKRWWAAVYGVAQSRTRLKRLSSSSSSSKRWQMCPPLTLWGFELTCNQQNVAEVTPPVPKDTDWLVEPFRATGVQLLCSLDAERKLRTHGAARRTCFGPQAPCPGLRVCQPA